MYRTYLSFCFLFFSVIATAQTTQTVQYFQDRHLDEPAKQEKALFSETVTTEDSIITTEIKDLKANKIIQRYAYKGNEPVGIWISAEGNYYKELDYNFSLTYIFEPCSSSFSDTIVQDFFVDDYYSHYSAPKVSSAKTYINKYIQNAIFYPEKAKTERSQGTTVIAYTITKEGKIEHIFIKKSAGAVLDKEAARVIRQMIVTSPAMLNGEAQTICVTSRIKFNLITE